MSKFGGTLSELGNVPVILIADQEDKKRLKGYEAHKANILAAIQIANIVKTSFGPKGMDKIIVSPDGDVTVTNDGATILKKTPVEHECARLLVELSKSQDDQIGDGTTGVVILAGALLEQALKLLEKKIHPLKIADGFENACQIAIKRCEEIAQTISTDPMDDVAYQEIMRKAAMTALSSKVVSSQTNMLADMCVKAVMAVADKDRKDVNFDLIKVESKASGRLEDSILIDGIALDKDFSHSQMAKKVENAKIAILTCPFEPPKPKTKHKLNIKSSEAYAELYQREQEYFREMVESVKKCGANVVLCQWGFDDEANHLLLKNNLPAVRWVGGQEIELISLATGGQIIPRFEDLAPHKLGNAAVVREISMGTEDEKLLLIEGCPKGKAVTLFIRGGNQMVVSEAKRCVHDALCVIRNLISDPRVVPGGGAVETAASLTVEAVSRTISTSEQYVVEAFAEALLSVPAALAENTGLSAIELIGTIKSRQIAESNPNIGINCHAVKADDMAANQVFESLSSKTHQLALATQVVKMILKIDDIIVPSDFGRGR